MVERRAVEPIVPLRMFGNPILRVALATLLIVGFSMFGALTFLPLYLQIVHGASATESGLELIPVMVFVLIMAIYSGRRVSATGTYRRFPIMGTALMTASIFLLATLGVHTPYWKIAIYMAILGLGLGMTMQILMLAAQNSVPYRELGVATSMSTFARSIGGSLGVAVFGTIFNTRLSHQLPTQISSISGDQLTKPVASAITKLHGSSVTANPDALKHEPDILRHAIQVAFSNSLHGVFLIGGPIVFVALLLAVRLREIPLRSVTGPSAMRPSPEPAGEELGEAFGMPPAPNSGSVNSDPVDSAGSLVDATADGGHERLEPDSLRAND
jgi:MFS family permease